MVKIFPITEFEKFQQMEFVWNEFFKCSVNQTLFLTHGWLSTWWKSFSPYRNRELLILEVREKNNLIGLVPLMRQKIQIKGVPIKTISFIENGHTPLADLLFLPGKSDVVMSNVLSFLLNKKANNHLVQLGKLRKDSPTHGEIERCCHEQKVKYILDCHRVTQLIPTTQKWDVFLKSRSNKFRKSLRNKLNRLSRLEGIRIYPDTIGDDIGIEAAISQICDISRHSWKAEKGSDINSIGGSIQFHRNMLHTIVSVGGKARVWWMVHKDAFVAYELHLVYDGTVYPILADYDQSFSEMSPGSMVEYHAIKDCFDSQDITAYNTCADNYWYLRNWTSDYIRYDIYNIYSHTLVSNLLFFLKSKIIPFLRPNEKYQN